MTLLLPLPLGPTTEEKDCARRRRQPAGRRANALCMRALWNGPMRCSPAYDLKLVSTISWMTRRCRDGVAMAATRAPREAKRDGGRLFEFAGGTHQRSSRRDDDSPHPSMADDAAAPEEAAAAAAEGGAAGSPAKHKRSALAPRIKRLMQACAPAYRAALSPR
jgi:hypothetical protein